MALRTAVGRVHLVTRCAAGVGGVNAALTRSRRGRTEDYGRRVISE
jgi:hypothetical protein